MGKIKVLFVCIHNSARSQMAEELLRQKGGDAFQVESAGIEPGTLNPLAVAVLKEAGIDITGKKPQSAFELYKQGHLYHYVITVCDETSAEKCPLYPGPVQRLHWGFKDPSAFQGSWEEKLAKTREVRDEILKTVTQWVPVALMKNKPGIQA
ncbi:MAG: arsenate reductase [Omnitrophica bacterium GWA2_52_12]|nr:MAG: arsenate reductase [Omnitrophica bacterium GWA2_52_12]